MELLFFANSSNKVLVEDLLDKIRLIPTFRHSRLADMALRFHPDMEPFVEIKDNVRRGQGRKCIVVGCIATDSLGSINDHAMETLVLLDALKRADAEIEALILPYLPYARQDRRKGETTDRTSITSALFADMLACAAPCRVYVVEPHAICIEGFFAGPMDRIPVIHVFVEPLRRRLTDPQKICVVSPDRGGWERASALATLLGTSHPIAWIDKRRSAPGKAKAYQLVGDVAGLDVVLVDDMIDTAGSICQALTVLKEADARRLLVCAVHGLFSHPALERLSQSPVEHIFVTSSVAQKSAVLDSPLIEVVPIGGLLASAVDHFMAGESLRTLNQITPR